MKAGGETMANSAQLSIDGKSIDLPILVGSEGEKAIDIRQLRAQTGYVTLDQGFMNTGAVTSNIAFIDGDAGILHYRGIPIEELAEKSNFVEVAYLLIYGKLPNADELSRFSALLTLNSPLHEDMRHFFDRYPTTAHPMAILSAMVCSLSSFYPEALKVNDRERNEETITQLLAKMRTIAAYSYKKSVGEPFVYPQDHLSYCANFLNMMFSVPSRTYEIDEEIVKVLNQILILHADHEQNCSTSTVRLVGSAQANVFAVVSAGICALWGPLHGGANEGVLDMLEEIHRDGGGTQKFIDLAKRKDSGFKLMGFGHRVYKNYDPRAKIIKAACDRVLARLNRKDPLLDIARVLEEAALKDPYFVERKLYPNVDFYSGIIYRALRIPTNMFTVMFAIGRLPGWLAHWKEMHEDPATKIGRPRQIYTGAVKQHYIPLEKRT
jgi:citrate synthase